MADFTNTKLQTPLTLIARDEIRDIYAFACYSRVFVSTDRISVSDVVMKNVLLHFLPLPLLLLPSLSSFCSP